MMFKTPASALSPTTYPFSSSTNSPSGTTRYTPGLLPTIAATVTITITTTTAAGRPPPLPTKASAGTRTGDRSSLIVSNGTNWGTAFSASGTPTHNASSPFSTDETTLHALLGTSSAFTSLTATITYSPTTLSTQAPDRSAPRGISAPVTIALSAALGVITPISVVLAAIFYIRRRDRRRRGNQPHAHGLERLQAAGSDADRVRQRGREDIHLAVIDIRSSPAAPDFNPHRAPSIQTSNGLIISPATSSHSPQSGSGDSVRPLLSHTESGSGATEPNVGEGVPLSWRASSQGSDTWSRYGVVGEATEAQGETHDIERAAGSGVGELGDPRDVGKSTTVPNVQATAGRRRRLSLPATPATMKLLPAVPLPADTSAFCAGPSSGARGPRFVPVTVLMEVREDSDLEEHDQPPPYELPSRS